MAVFRESPYSGFNFQVQLDSATGAKGEIVGGFSDVSGLDIDITYAEYRNGNDVANTARKVQGLHKHGDVTLKRGVIGSTDLFALAKDTRKGKVNRRPSVTILLMDETGDNKVATFTLINAQVKKWTGPTLSGKGELAMEELHLVHEGIEFT